MLLLLTSALAAPSGYTISAANVDGCELSLGPKAADGVVPMHAICQWADVKLETFNRVVASWPKHADVFAVVVESKVQRVEGEKSLVYQLQRSKGISDREVLMWMWHATVSGADRYAWNTATAEALTPKDGNVRVSRTEGYWQAKAEGAGVTVEHHLEYAPGGSVPGFLVRWFQTSGLEANVKEMHAAVK